MAHPTRAVRALPPTPPAQADPPDASAASILSRLARPFDPRELSYKCQAVSKDRTRALAIWYVDARAVMDRLDAVMELDWQTEFETYDDSTVVCKISLWIDGRSITRSDVGGTSGNEVDRDGKVDATFGKKTAFSDALKRAAVHFGVGRYLYQLEGVWLDWDDQRGEFKTAPRLPDWAMPNGSSQNRVADPDASGGSEDDGGGFVEVKQLSDRANAATIGALQACIAKLHRSDNAVRLSLSARFGEGVTKLEMLTQAQAESLKKDLDRLVRTMGSGNGPGIGTNGTVRGRKGGR